MHTYFFCLSKEDIEYIIDKELGLEEIYDNHFLSKKINEARDWDLEFICLNYFFARIIDKKEKFNSENIINYKNTYFDLVNKMGITYEDFNSNFIRSLFNEEHYESLNLEEQLIEITKKIYDKRH